MTRTCKQCNKTFPITSPKKVFCSKKCGAMFNRIKKCPVKKCKICNKPFHVHKSHPDQKYCSKECQFEGRKKQITIKCKECGKDFTTYEARSKAKYCSWECHAKKTELTCAYCGNTFFVRRSDAGERFTCSRSCSAKYRAKIGKAPHQGKPRSESTKKKVSEGLKKYYGGDPKKHWNYKEGPFAQKRGTHSSWQAQRQLARERDKFKCQCCGVTEKELGKQLSVHHVKPFRSYKKAENANKLENLICTCQSCHMKLEHGKIDLPKR